MKKIFLLLLFLALLKPEKGNSQKLLVLASEIAKSSLELKGGYDNIKKVESIVRDIENGGSPNIESYGSDWSALTSGYRKAAETIRNAALITDFDSKPYSVSAEELSNCYIKEQNFKKLNGYKKELEDAVVRGQEELVKITEFKSLIEQNKASIKYLIDVSQKLSGVPIFGEIFQWNWFELEAGVKPSLNELASAVNSHEKKLVAETEKVKKYCSNLIFNLSGLESSICLVSGTYSGNCVVDEESMLVRLAINGNSSPYNGRIAVTSEGETDEFGVPAIVVSQNRYLSFSLQDGSDTYSFTGELNPSYTKIINFKLAGDNTSCTLSR